ncbi:hypothetical protein JG687_00018529 [Phytophthora cactorum]|uniref:BED-type domain-containing protein n=2 Tax=Phytophthora cactorum TaxID=29920 RepID=A0A8T1TKG9_9STRA|nr:hypothetical protein JG687_00018529 [Phytophthora cactorum]
MILPSRNIYNASFQAVVNNPNSHPCICGKVYQQDLTNGYHNLLKHLVTKHKGYEALTKPDRTLQPTITDFLERGPCDLDKWSEWIVMKMLPISFCEDPITRRNIRLRSTTQRTLKAHMFGIMRRVKKVIRLILASGGGGGNVTRWSSTMKMLDRCVESIPYMQRMSSAGAIKARIDKLMLTPSEAIAASTLLADLKQLDTVTLEFQSEKVVMNDSTARLPATP